MARRVAFISLGCAKNLVDTEVMIAKLGAAGWELCPDSGDADAIVVNTCAFIDPAKAESTDAIMQQAHKKKSGQQLIVAGCLAQRYGEQLQALVPEIDGIVGTGSYASIVEVLSEASEGARPARLGFEAEPEHDFLPRLVTTPRATAYLKIAEGCDHPCTFCIIPQLRGRFRSRGEEAVLKEARALAGAGARELVLIAQDSSMWGRDRGWKRGGLAHLLRRLNEIEDLEWIRLLYLYPATIDRELIAAMAELPKVCKYMDMPLQHAHPEMLRAMLRPGSGERYLEILESFRERIPDLTMRSTFIIGFPGERDEHVEYMEEWIARAQLDRVGFFQYSREDGTPAARLGEQVPASEQRRRLVRLREAQRAASQIARSRRIGRTVRVLVEERTRRGWKGRSMGEAPGVDGAIHFTGKAVPGEFVDVTLERSTAFDFHGRMNHG